MVDRDVICNRISYIEDNIRQLNELAKLTEAEFLSRFYYVASAKYLLQTAIEAMLDIAHHIIARQRYRAPRTYAEVFSVLVEHGILPAESENTYRQIAKFRNRVVHLYHEVANKEVFQILKEGISDIQAFVKAIVAYMGKNS
ncbi:type VII toxin-antitoxin system HepT family RNase toxin [Sporolituus thermophilus]|uniref:Uncharacterized conserved protein YutE, UPF0331/DUF86 family n=1 Tax=Sporolituus thermophilus DSM 23256 TaxID=1123285 RepID=A0A1G7NG43_9FIRM|nr:DUF86 domain-containing protein [Sporolituus thermophilus]SDF73034.1 Uncharacterized conserved protein YutE, UPF0331/DUF86 family [Sporolituus thermophilus DSM 23256]